ncbi:MAG: glycerate kinase [Spirochaetales bacterium]|uniref:Glycerate kinase n=1 Tax=Candidatus Thalassospirochaeta sargassi TaxID=3119039 RepID=A0AAJ1IBX7_9SPIO|nr:glycerate kinase [Spirochaetales bacterium]
MAGEFYKKDLTDIFMTAVNRVNPESMLLNQCSLDGDTLTVSLHEQTEKYNLGDYNRVIVIGAGKATARMAKAVEAILGDRITEGLIAVKYGHTEDLSIIRTIESGHPVPDGSSVQAAEEILRLAHTADEKTLVINLISGGGSALLCMPYKNEEWECTFAAKQDTTKLLLECGAEITEINTIRKHLSGIKGGRLAEAIYPADSLNLILSDVIGDRLDSIASGLTVPDSSTFQEAIEIIEKYKLKKRMPTPAARIMMWGEAGTIPETPKPGNPIFEKSRNVLIGTNLAALKSAETAADKLGFNTAVLSSQITGEASEAAKFYLGIGRDIRRDLGMLQRPACIIAGGETTVTIRGSGIGGRNQEMALAFLAGLKNEQGIYFLSGGTDGNDGPTDAAGAFAAADIYSAGIKAGLSIQSYLDNNDSYNYFKQTGGLLITGPTNTNVCDVQIMLVV